MAQWTQTLEPYVKVQEQVMTAPLNPTAGEDLIVGVVLISDAGPSVPTLISSQKEYLETYTSKDLTQDYLESLKKLYTGADKEIPTTMWANGYRLAGSNHMLVVRASKANDIYFSKPMAKGDMNTYILRDGLLMKKVGPSEKVFKFVLDIDADDADHDQDGWAIAISGVGVLGNRTTDEGPQYDYYVNNLPDLVEQLNETSKFFSPSYKYYTDVKCENEIEIDADSDIITRGKVRAVLFDEVYLGSYAIDTTDERCPEGYMYVIPCEPDWETPADTQKILDLNSTGWSGFEEVPYYAVNLFNSATELKVRIRRFNHDAVITKALSDFQVSQLTAAGQSPYTVLTSVLDTFTKGGTAEPSKSNLERDFFEVAVWDPAVNDQVSFFNVGTILGRGDMEVSEINSLLSMIQLELPDDLHDLGLNYYGYTPDDYTWVNYTEEFNEETDVVTGYVATVDELWSLSVSENTIYALGTAPSHSESWNAYEKKSGDVVKGYKASLAEIQAIEDPENGDIWGVGTAEDPTAFYKFTVIDVPASIVDYYKYITNGEDQIFADLTIDPTKYDILKVSDSDLKRALDQIILDEVYQSNILGLCDLGNTELSFQNYMANYAINDGYFYAISTVNSTNYMTIANSITKIAQNSFRLYASAPWDIDTGNLGWKFYASPAVLYWEAVARNRRNNEEFRAVLGQVGGIVQYQRPVTEFNLKTRQLLLSKKINTVKWNVATQAWNMNDNYTKQSEDNIMSDEANSRLALRIRKAQPVLLRQFIGRQISEVLCAEIKNCIDYWFKTSILPMTYTVEAYQIFCNFDAQLARQNKVKVTINVRFYRTLKYVNVYDRLFDTQMDISSDQ